MGDVQSATFGLKIKRIILRPYYELKWLAARWILAKRFYVSFLNAKNIEKNLKNYRQKMNDFKSVGDSKKQEYLEMKGFCEGIEYCIYGKWFDE